MADKLQPACDQLIANITSLKNSIENIDKVKLWLTGNTNEAKSQIHAVVSRQLETLRSREVWLLNQVDLLQSSKRTALDLQLKALWACLGCLQGCLARLGDNIGREENAAKAIEEQELENTLTDCLHRFDQLDLSPADTPYISFHAEVSKLRETICKFGKIQSKALPMEMAFAPTADLTCAQSLPQMVEDYDDDQHHVMYKTVQDVQQEQGQAVRVCVNVPRLPPSSLQLSSKPGAPPAGSPCGPVPQEWHRWLLAQQQQRRQAAQTPHIQQWMRELHREAILEQEEEQEREHSCLQGSAIQGRAMHNKVEVESPGGSSGAAQQDYEYFKRVLSSPYESWLKKAEAIRSSCTISPSVYQGWLSYFQTVSCDVNSWLLSSIKAQQEDKLDGCCGGQCMTPQPLTSSNEQLDIENLHTLACTKPGSSKPASAPASAWLSRESLEMEDESVARVCRANERCGSFDECLCNENCRQHLVPDQPLPQSLKNLDNHGWLLMPAGPAADEPQQPLFNYFEAVQDSNRLAWLFEPAGGAHDRNMDGTQALFQALQLDQESCVEGGRWLLSGPEVMDDDDTTDTVSEASTFSVCSKVTCSSKATSSQASRMYEREPSRDGLFNHVDRIHESGSSGWLVAQSPPSDSLDTSDVMKKWLRFSAENSSSNKPSPFLSKSMWLLGENYLQSGKVDPDRDEMDVDKTQEMPEYLEDAWLRKTADQESQRSRTCSELSFEILCEKEAMFLANQNGGPVMDWLSNNHH